MSRISSPASSSQTGCRISSKASAATNSRRRLQLRAAIGESSAIVNVIWGGSNFVVGGALLRVFFPPLRAVSIATMLGVLSMALFLANRFGKVRNSAPHP